MEKEGEDEGSKLAKCTTILSPTSALITGPTIPVTKNLNKTKIDGKK